MILEGHFYTIVQPVIEGNNVRAIIKINPDHEIFLGHFPGQPVVPGVCMMQMVKELLEKATGKNMRLRNGLDLKFLSVIDPRKNSLVNMEASYTGHGNGEIQVTARLFYKETTFFKFKGIFMPSAPGLSHEVERSRG